MSKTLVVAVDVSTLTDDQISELTLAMEVQTENYCCKAGSALMPSGTMNTLADTVSYELAHMREEQIRGIYTDEEIGFFEEVLEGFKKLGRYV